MIVNATANDTQFSTRNGREATQSINAAEYYLDIPPWQTGASPVAMLATDGVYNEKFERLTGTIDTKA